MHATKENKAKLQIVISALVLTVLFIAELYLMIKDPAYSIIPIVLLGVLALVAVYALIEAVMTLSAEKEAERQAHFDNIYKSEKASYIMLKNKFEEIEGKLAIIQENSKIPSEEIINAQKGIAKVIINRNKENADAIINSNDQVLERLDEMDETQNTKFTGISKDQRLKLAEMTNQTELKLQDMVVQLKDMELRLNQAIMQGSPKVVVAAPPVEEPISEKPLFASEPLVMEDDLFHEETPAEEPIVEEAPVVEEVPIIEEVPVVEEVPIAEEKPATPEIDLSDPNKAMSPDEIAALFASMSANEPATEEPVPEEVVEEIPIVEEKPAAPEIDLSDPNKAMSPDEIAALFASMSANESVAEAPAEPEMEEPVVEDVPPMPDLSDPNRTLSPDEIAALIANL